MIDLEKMFEKYDNSLLNCLTFEIRINNVKVAIFYELFEAQKYINDLFKDFCNFRWFILSSGLVIVFDFRTKEVCND